MHISTLLSVYKLLESILMQHTGLGRKEGMEGGVKEGVCEFRRWNMYYSIFYYYYFKDVDFHPVLPQRCSGKQAL